MSKAKRTFSEPLPERNWQALKSNVLVKRGVGAFFTFAAADFGAQLWARYRRMLIVDAKHDFTSPSAQGHDTKRALRSDWDLPQCLRSALFGGFFYAPLRLRWHVSLDKLFPLTEFLTPPEKRATLAKRFVSDHLFFIPSLVAFYFAFQSLMELCPLADAPKRSVLGLPSAVVWSWGMWIPIQALCWFALPPFTWNAMTVVATLGWVGYMADLNRRMRRAVVS
jgi:hypothetical protein